MFKMFLHINSLALCKNYDNITISEIRKIKYRFKFYFNSNIMKHRMYA